MKRIALILAGLLVVLMLVTGADAYRAHRFVLKAGALRVGDSRAQVQAKLGRPTEVFRPPQPIPSGVYLGVYVETWAYGAHFDYPHSLSSRFPYFCPFALRPFGPASNDLRIEFDAGGKVSRVLPPGT